MSQSVSHTPDISVLDYSGDKPQALYFGLPKGAWTQILILTALMAALFRFNLVRLWGKTNPIDGQDTNWQHSMFVPLIGLWYLFIHRDELVVAARAPVRREASIRTFATLGLGVIALACSYLTGAGAGWQAVIIALTIIGALPNRLIRLMGAEKDRWPEMVRWLGRIGATAALYLLACFGPNLSFSPAPWHLFEATVLLVAILGAAIWLPLVIPTSTMLGAAVIFGGLLTFAAAIYPIQNDYAKDLGMVATLFGVVTLLGGWSVMRIAWFPIAFLVVALPWPELVYQKLAWPLQKLAAGASVGTLRVFNVEARRDETTIWFMVPGKGGTPEWESLSVAEACAGLRSLMTFLMVAGTVAFLQRRKLWEKLFITFSAIPIAIFCNMMRVSGQGLLHRYVSKETSQGFAHSFVGLLMLIPGFFLILLVQWVLEKLFIEEAEGSQKAAASNRKIVAVAKKKVAPAISDASGASPSETSPGVVGAIAGAVANLGRTGTPAVAGMSAGVSADSMQPAATTRPTAAPARPAARATAAPTASPTKPTAAPAKPAAAQAATPAPAQAKPAAQANPAAAPAQAARAAAARVAANPATPPVAGAPVKAPVVSGQTTPAQAARPAVAPAAGAIPATGATPPRPTATPGAQSARVAPPSGLLPSPVKRPVASGGAPGASTLKPSSRPAGAGTPIPPAAGGMSAARAAARPAAAPGAAPAAPKPPASAIKPLASGLKPPAAARVAPPAAPQNPAAAAKPPVNPNSTSPEQAKPGTESEGRS